MILIRNMASIDLCSRCGLASKDMNHLLRECNSSKYIWVQIKDTKWWEDGCGQPLCEWVVENLKNKTEFFGKKWYTIFIVTLWQLWKDWNKFVFESQITPIQISLKNMRNYVHEIDEAFHSILHPNPSHPRLIKWFCPPVGKLKLNVAGCSKGMQNRFNTIKKCKIGSTLISLTLGSTSGK